MGFTYVKIQPFSDGIYEDELDITDYVLSNLKIIEKTSSSDFSSGIVNYSDLKLTLDNSKNTFVERDARGIFRAERDRAKIKVYWSHDQPAVCGFSRAGFSRIATPILIGEWYLLDDLTKFDYSKKEISITATDFISIKTKLPTTSIWIRSVGDNYYSFWTAFPYGATITFYDFPNDPLSQLDNEHWNGLGGRTWWGPPQDLPMNDLSEKYLNKPLGDFFKDISDISGAFLVFYNNKPFFGSPSELEKIETFDFKTHELNIGAVNRAENIVSISNMRRGLNDLINYLSFNNFVIKNDSSVSRYGLKRKEVSTELVNQRFSYIFAPRLFNNEIPMNAFDVEIELNADNLGIKFFDNISIIVSPIYKDNLRTVLDIAELDVSYIPSEDGEFLELKNRTFKVYGREIDFNDESITLTLKEVY